MITRTRDHYYKEPGTIISRNQGPLLQGTWDHDYKEPGTMITRNQEAKDQGYQGPGTRDQRPRGPGAVYNACSPLFNLLSKLSFLQLSFSQNIKWNQLLTEFVQSIILHKIIIKDS